MPLRSRPNPPARCSCHLHGFTEHADLIPTLLDLAGLDVPPSCQGRSFAPLLRGEPMSLRDATYAEVCFPWMRNPFPDYASFRAAWESTEPADIARRGDANYNIPGDHTRAVRTARWSYLWYGDGFQELYHLEHDPHEWHNIAADPAHAEILAAMRELLREKETQARESRSSAAAAEYPPWISVPT